VVIGCAKAEMGRRDDVVKFVDGLNALQLVQVGDFWKERRLSSYSLFQTPDEVPLIEPVLRFEHLQCAQPQSNRRAQYGDSTDVIVSFGSLFAQEFQKDVGAERDAGAVDLRHSDSFLQMAHNHDDVLRKPGAIQCRSQVLRASAIARVDSQGVKSLVKRLLA